MNNDTRFHETIFRLGSITRHRRVENEGVLASIAEIAKDFIGADVVFLCLHADRISESASHCAVHGPWDVDHSCSFVDQTKWSSEDRGIEHELENKASDTLYRRSELIEEARFRDSRQYKDFHAPMNLGDMAVAYHTKPGGPSLVFAIMQADADSTIDDEMFARAQKILPIVFKAFDEAWNPVPAWVDSLKPQAKRILQHVLDGHDDEQIAARTGQTYHSVRAHLKRLFRVAEVRSRLHLMQAYLTGKNSDSLDKQISELLHHRKNTGTATEKPVASIAG